MSDLVAYPARDVARVLTRSRDLMRAYKEAAREDQVQAVASGGRNYVVVHDAAVRSALQTAAPDLPSFAFDADTGEVDDPGATRKGRGWRKSS